VLEGSVVVAPGAVVGDEVELAPFPEPQPARATPTIRTPATKQTR